MMKRKLSVAWEKWQYEAAVMKAQKFTLGGTIRRSMRRQLSMAWEKMKFYASKMAALKDE